MGGRARQHFFATVWSLKLSPNELDNSLSEENCRLQQEVATLQASIQTPSRSLREIQPGSGGHKHTAKHYLKRHERRLKKQRVSECTSVLAWLEDEGLTPVKVVVMNKETQQLDSILLRSDIEKALDVGDEQISDQDVDMITMMLYIKDKYNVSGTSYHEMASLCHEMPRHYRLKRKIAELNAQWNIHVTPAWSATIIGEHLQQFAERLVSWCMFVYYTIFKWILTLACARSCTTLHVHVYHNDIQVECSPPDSVFITNHKLRVKVTGDGTNIAKHLHVVNFAFTILEEGDKAHSVTGNHCIAIFKAPESYDAMKLCLRDIVQDVRALDTIHVFGRNFKVEFYLGGDWKFLAMITGIDSATVTHSCIWCKCPSLKHYDSSQT